MKGLNEKLFYNARYVIEVMDDILHIQKNFSLLLKMI